MKLAAAILVLSAAPALAVELPPDLAKAVQDYDRAQIHNDIRNRFVLAVWPGVSW
jgi:hypothetical protein